MTERRSVGRLFGAADFRNKKFPIKEASQAQKAAFMSLFNHTFKTRLQK